MVEIHENLFQPTEHEESLADPLFGPPEPINDFLLVKLWQVDNEKIGSIVTPEKFRQRSNQAIVVGIGDKVTSRVNVGDRVTMGIGNTEDASVNGENLLIIREGDVRLFERKL